MPKSKPPYPPEFRAEAIRLARTSGKPHAEIARDLGMTGETLRLWLKQTDLDEGKRSNGLTSDEQEELHLLCSVEYLRAARPHRREYMKQEEHGLRSACFYLIYADTFGS